MGEFDQEDDAARRRARGSAERVTGIPNVRRSRPDLDEERTPIEPIEARRRARAGESMPVDATLVPAPWDDTTETRLAAARAGFRVAAPPQQGASEERFAELPWWKSGSGLAKVIAACAACITAAGGLAVPIINALKQPDVANETLRKLEEERAAREREAPDQKKLEEAKERERQHELDELKSKLRELDVRYPAPKVDPRRPPKY